MECPTPRCEGKLGYFGIKSSKHSGDFKTSISGLPLDEWTQAIARQREQVKQCVKSGTQSRTRKNTSLQNCVQNLSLSTNDSLPTFTDDALWKKCGAQNLHQAVDLVGRAVKVQSEKRY